MTDWSEKHLTEHDLYLFNEGSHIRLYHKFGAHPCVKDGVAGTNFAVWAPGAQRVYVIGGFNGWNKSSHGMFAQGTSGVWECFIPGLDAGVSYKYHIVARDRDFQIDKCDPVGFHAETPPHTASIVWDLAYEWHDQAWMKQRKQHNSLQAPISIYEVHLGSWMRHCDQGDRSFTYREIAPRLADHLNYLGFTHVEFLPLMEHPFFGSWGYQTAGYFAPTSRYGTPQDMMYLIDYLHQRGLGVILDWVPSHFPGDDHGLHNFDGTHLYEHEDPQQGFHPDWKSYIFNYGRHEVRSFLMSSAMYWLDKYHIDGIRVDAVASMLYLDYSRKEGEWIANEHGGNENLPAISFLRRFNEEVYRSYPDVQTYAEESTAWAMVSRPVWLGGLGFGLKWDMGWMHDTLQYFEREPIHRQYHHNEILFRMVYAFTENFVLPLSHDEVVHGKGSLLSKMPGDEWQQFANLRTLYGYMFAQPGKKLLFMGCEWGQGSEWKHDFSLDWHQCDYPQHAGILRLVADLGKLYRTEPALHELDCKPEGFQWIDCSDNNGSIISFLRRGFSSPECILVVCNLTPVPRPGYRVGVPHPGFWRELLNTDAGYYGGSGSGNCGGLEAESPSWHGQGWSLNLTLPPLSVVFLKGGAQPGHALTQR